MTVWVVFLNDGMMGVYDSKAKADSRMSELNEKYSTQSIRTYEQEVL